MTPKLTDRQALLRHRERARRRGARSFLHDEARLEVQERLNEVNRTFRSPAIITAFPELWGELIPEAVVVPDAETLDLVPARHDLIVHALTLHWADDPVGQLIQCRRALKPDGLFLAVMFGGGTLSELRTAFAEAETRLRGGISPRVLPMADIRDLGALLQRAGFALPVADRVPRTIEYRNLPRLFDDLRDMGETNALDQRDRKPVTRALLSEALRIYGAHYLQDNGRVRATFEFVFLTGWSPDPSQQQPMRPGTARHRLADALGTSELNPETDVGDALGGTRDPHD